MTSPQAFPLEFALAAAATGVAGANARSDAASSLSTEVPVALLNAKHPLYDLYKNTWADLDLLYEGATRLKASSDRFLFRKPKELTEIYNCRRGMFTYENILGTGLNWYVSKLFKQPPVIDIKNNGEAIEPPDKNGGGSDPEWEFYHRFESDCDRAGTDYGRFGQEVFRQMLLLGVTYVVIDLPPDTQRAANAQEQIIEPYVSLFSPLDAINWKTDAYGELEWIVFYSQKEEGGFLNEPVTVERWYYYDKQEFRVYERRENKSAEEKQTATLVDSGPHAMADYKDHPDSPETGRVPVVRCKLPDGLWLGQRVRLQVVDHLNTDNGLRWALFNSCLSMPVIKSDREFVDPISETGFIQIGAGDSIEFMEPGGKSIDAASNRLQTLREEIFRSMYLQAQGRSSNATAASASGYSKEMDMASSKDVLSSLGTMLRAALQQILTFIGKIRRDQDVEFDVRGLSYDEAPPLAQLITLQELLEMPIQSDTFKKEIQKEIVRLGGDKWNDTVKTTCCDEIEKAPPESEVLAAQQANDQMLMQRRLQNVGNRLTTRAAIDGIE